MPTSFETDTGEPYTGPYPDEISIVVTLDDDRTVEITARKGEADYDKVLTSYMFRKGYIPVQVEKKHFHFRLHYKGGPGSGHRGHAGRPGKVGGSLPGGGGYGPFPNKKIRDAAYDYLIGTTYSRISREPWLIHDTYKTMMSYATDYHDALNQGMRIYVWDEARQHGEEYTVTPEQFKAMLAEVTAKRDERLEFVRQTVNLPPRFETLLEGIPYQELNVYGNSPERMQYMDLIDQRVRARMKDIDATSISERELEDLAFEQYFEQTQADLGEKNNADGWLWYYAGEMHREQDYEIRHQVALGNIHPDYAGGLGSSDGIKPQGGQWEPLPNELYHATTNFEAIVKDRIRSRKELGGRRAETGLGGGEDDTISFGTSREVVQQIERSLHEAHMVANGQFTLTKMFTLARDGGGGVGHNWAKRFVGFLMGREAEELPDDFDPIKE